MRLELRTDRREQLVDITDAVRDAARTSGTTDGAVLVFCPHTTAAITINENADPDVVSDVLRGLAQIAPRQGGWRHAEGNSDGHLKSSLVGPSVLVPIVDGELALGVWQAVYFCEFDGPRSRHYTVSVMGAAGGGR